MPTKENSIKVKHPVKGYVVFYNPTIREKEILEDYALTKKSLQQIKPILKASVAKFNSSNPSAAYSK